MNITELKKQAAEAAVDYIKSGMVVGLGTGSTAIHATRKLGRLLADRSLSDIVAIPTSCQTADDAAALNIPLTTLDKHPIIDVTIDGADEITPTLDVIKGGGGALLHEKIVAQATKQLIIVADGSKYVPTLGTSWALPIEVIPFGAQSQYRFLQSLGRTAKIREDKDDPTKPFLTDEGNLIIDTQFGLITDPYALAHKLNNRTGIVEHGLFLGMATMAIIATETGITQYKL